MQAARSYLNCLYETPWDSTSLRWLFTYALQVHWATPVNHTGIPGGSALGCLRWASEDEVDTVTPSELLTVAPDWTFDEKRPTQGIYVGFPQGFQFAKQGVNHWAGEEESMAVNHYSTLSKGPVVIRCVHRNPDTALLMAESTHLFLHALRQHLMGSPQFRGMDPQALGGPQLLEKSGERMFKVDGAWNFAFTYVGEVHLESHPLKAWEAKILGTH